MRNHIPFVSEIIQFALGAFMDILSVNGCTRRWKAHGCNQHFDENYNTHIGKSQSLRKEGIAIINKVLAMRSGFTKIIVNLHVSSGFEWPHSNLHIAENACCMDYINTWSSKLFHCPLHRHSTNHSTTSYRCENMVICDIRVVWTNLPIISINPQVDQELTI